MNWSRYIRCGILSVLILGAAGADEVLEKSTLPVLYLGIRTDGEWGEGTEAEPYDASTAERFDALLANLRPGSIVHLAPGVYPTLGAVGFNSGFGLLPPGAKLEGSGEGKTIIRLDPGAMAKAGTRKPQYFAVLESRGNTDGCEVSNLTIDCNAQNMHLSNREDAIEGVALNGSHCAIRHVEVINAYGGGLETFVLIIGPLYKGVGDVSENVIEDCWVHQYVNGKNTDGAVIGFSSDADGKIIGSNHCQMRRNRVEGGRMGYACGGSDNRVENNEARGVAWGFYGDSGTMDRILVLNNTFEAHEDGVKIAPDTSCHYSGILFIGNTILLTASGANGFFLDHANAVGGSAEKCLFTGNTIRSVAGKGQTQLSVLSDRWTDCLFTGNVSTLPFNLSHASPTFVVEK